MEFKSVLRSHEIHYRHMSQAGPTAGPAAGPAAGPTGPGPAAGPSVPAEAKEKKPQGPARPPKAEAEEFGSQERLKKTKTLKKSHSLSHSLCSKGRVEAFAREERESVAWDTKDT